MCSSKMTVFGTKLGNRLVSLLVSAQWVLHDMTNNADLLLSAAPVESHVGAIVVC
jgi:hypothetical protein